MVGSASPRLTGAEHDATLHAAHINGIAASARSRSRRLRERGVRTPLPSAPSAPSPRGAEEKPVAVDLMGRGDGALGEALVPTLGSIHLIGQIS